MLTLSPHTRAPAKQKGVVLLIALIVLVAMTLAGIALVRSVDTTNVIAGNLAFQQAATQSGDVGTESGITWLTGSTPPSAACPGSALWCDDATNGYTSNGNLAANNPIIGQTWDAFWKQTLAARAKALSTDAAGNSVSYVIDRLCSSAGDPSAGANCSTSPAVGAAVGGSEESNEPKMGSQSQVFYRITSRISGPRNTVSYVQVIYAM